MSFSRSALRYPKMLRSFPRKLPWVLNRMAGSRVVRALSHGIRSWFGAFGSAPILVVLGDLDLVDVQLDADLGQVGLPDQHEQLHLRPARRHDA